MPWGTVVLLVVVGVLVVVGMAFPGLRRIVSTETLSRMAGWAGGWAPLLFAGLMAVAVVISPIPNVPVAAFTGMVYGPWFGTAISAAGGLAGACLAFAISRRFGREVIQRLFRRPVHFCDGCSDHSMAMLVFISRLIPVVSFNLISYGAGLSRMTFWKFALGTAVGMLPWTWVYTTVGSALLETPWLATSLGLVLTAAVLALPSAVRKYNVLGLRRLMMSDVDEPERSG